ncbi:vanin-like protein 2 [Plutella xylostella]|uniref:vanin-like protein 2 n=1 Tax=Plutella xylostella TaxID=51655 RepID=UPI002032424A|nr:vanin-like protein 2 [Plutella xylostella]
MRGVFLNFVVTLLCFGVTFSEVGFYKAGVVVNLKNGPEVESFDRYIEEAGKMKLDILMLPSSQNEGQRSSIQKRDANHYDNMIKSISSSARSARVYVMAQLEESVRCNEQYEVFENNVVFDRDGRMVSVFRKPVNLINSCNTTLPEVAEFSTDFGASFQHVVEEDILRSSLVGGRNYIGAGRWEDELPFLTATQFLSSWASSAGVNLLFNSGLFSSSEVKVVSLDDGSSLYVAELLKEPKTGSPPHSLPYPAPSKISKHEDLSQYSMRPLDVEAAARGYRDTVCDEGFCCEFYVKIGEPSQAASNYSLAVFSGARHGARHSLGVQTCALLACSSRSCVVEPKTSTSSVFFEEIHVSANFSKQNTIQLPTSLASTILPLPQDSYTFESKTAVDNTITVTMNLEKPSQIITFGIFGRDFSNDISIVSSTQYSDNESDGIFNEDLIDYVWIRLRVLIFIVSIYILEML